MDKVKVVWFILPFGFEIFHYELDIWGHPTGLDRADVSPSDVGAREFPVIRRQSCWYTKMEQDFTYSAMSIAQIPVPVPRSRMFCGDDLIGALWSSPPSSISHLRRSG